ncbi:MAG: S49 family peptidase, partial [Parvularculaceae bacterium]
ADYVDSIGQGRVWIGSKAVELKLVDKIGGLDEAVAAAAVRANLEKYDVVDMIERPTPFERFMGHSSAKLMTLAGFNKSNDSPGRVALKNLLREAETAAGFLTSFNDPSGLYARCLSCEGK